MEEFIPMSLKYNEVGKHLSPCIVVDVDETICTKNGRFPYDYSKVKEDLPKWNIIRLVILLSKKYKIVICTGREDICKTDTIDYIKSHGIEFEDFYIRKTGDGRPDWQVKEEMWEQICSKYRIEFMLDDRKQVIDHARKHGFTVLDVAGNTF